MRTLVISAVAAVLGAVCAWGATRLEFRQPERTTYIPNPAEKAPGVARVAVEGGDAFDFGQMEVNATTKHTFLLKNVGEGPLSLRKGKTTCKCTLSDLKEGTIAPGETAEVVLEVTPKEPTEFFEQSAEIITNDPVNNPLRLVMRGSVRESLKIEPNPSEIPIGQFSSADKFTYRIKVWSYREEPWQMTGFTLADQETAQFFDLTAADMSPEEVSQATDAKNGQILTLTIKPGYPLGSLRQKLHVEHNYADRGPLEMVLSGRSVGDITVFGRDYNAERDFVELGNIPSSQGKKSQLTILVKGNNRENTKLSVKSIDPESLKVTLGEPKTLTSAVSWPLSIEVPPGAEPVIRLGTEVNRLAEIELETTDPQVPVFRIRVRFAVTSEQ